MLSGMSLIGQRIEHATDGHRGTVRWMGLLRTNKANEAAEATEWLGIEWDAGERGRHSGNDPANPSQFLFRVKEQNSASFVKRDKLVFGRAFATAAIEKYVGSGTVPVPVPAKEAEEAERSSGLRMHRPGEDVAVELVGWDKMREKLRNLNNIHIAGLAGLGIAWIDADEDKNLKDLFPVLQDLDLSRNLFTSWEDVAQITRQLPKLDSLRLNSNRLEFLGTEPALLTSGFSNLKVLALNSTLIQWSTMEQLAPHTPNLTSLFLGFNKLSSFGEEYPENSTDFPPSDIPPLFPTLQAFHLDQNNLHSWPQLCHVVHSHMPQLNTLNVSFNKFTEILPETASIFQSLTTLNISENLLSSYTSIHSLNAFPKLVDIRIKNNPVLITQPPSHTTTTTTASTSHVSKTDDITSRLSKATRINGHAVSDRDRADAELYYLSKVAAWIHALETIANKSQEEVKQLVQEWHPRWDELCARYGRPEVAPVSATSLALKDRLLGLSFELVAGSEMDAGVLKKVEKKVPLGMTMRALRALVGRVLGVGGKEIRMRGVLKGGEGEESMVVELEEEMREVGFYEFKNGDTVQVWVL